MNRNEAFCLLVAALALITAGLTVRFGWIGLVTPGVAILAALLFGNKEEVKRDG